MEFLLIEIGATLTALLGFVSSVLWQDAALNLRKR